MRSNIINGAGSVAISELFGYKDECLIGLSFMERMRGMPVG